MHGADEHIVCCGDSNDHRYTVCLMEQQEFVRRNEDVRKKDSLFKERKSTFKCMKCNAYLSVGKEGSNCLYFFHFDFH